MTDKRGGLRKLTQLQLFTVFLILFIFPQSRTVKEPARETEREDIHYGEIDFSKQRPKAPSASVQDSEQQQETLYAQVKVSQTASSLTQTAEEPESLYAQVKKKRIE